MGPSFDYDDEGDTAEAKEYLAKAEELRLLKEQNELLRLNLEKVEKEVQEARQQSMELLDRFGNGYPAYGAQVSLSAAQQAMLMAARVLTGAATELAKKSSTEKDAKQKDLIQRVVVCLNALSGDMKLLSEDLSVGISGTTVSVTHPALDLEQSPVSNK